MYGGNAVLDSRGENESGGHCFLASFLCNQVGQSL
jgi:hypothetical protein